MRNNVTKIDWMALTSTGDDNHKQAAYLVKALLDTNAVFPHPYDGPEKAIDLVANFLKAMTYNLAGRLLDKADAEVND